MRLTKRYAPLHQVFGDVGRQQRWIRRGGAHRIRVEAHRLNELGQDGERRSGRVDGIEQRALVLLKVAVVCEGQTLEQRHQRHDVAHDTRRAPAGQLGGIGILLLRHQRRPGRVRVGKLGEPELG